jgi:hypothetical protein
LALENPAAGQGGPGSSASYARNRGALIRAK